MQGAIRIYYKTAMDNKIMRRAAARTAIVIMTTASDAFGFAVCFGKKTGE